MITRQYRMKLSTYARIRKNFQAIRGETCAQYFERLSRALEEVLQT